MFSLFNREGTNVRIIGRIKIYRGKVTLHCFRLLSIENEKEIELHELESKYAHLMNVKNMVEQPFWFDNSKNNMNNNNNNKENNNSFNNKNNTNNNNLTNNGNTTNDSEHHSVINNLNDLQKKIYFMVKSNNGNDEGTYIDTLVEKFGTKNDINSIRDALDELTNEGILYTTFDEEHFKTTN